MEFLVVKEMAAMYVLLIWKEFGVNTPALQDKLNLLKLQRIIIQFPIQIDQIKL